LKKKKGDKKEHVNLIQDSSSSSDDSITLKKNVNLIQDSSTSSSSDDRPHFRLPAFGLAGKLKKKKGDKKEHLNLIQDSSTSSSDDKTQSK